MQRGRAAPIVHKNTANIQDPHVPEVIREHILPHKRTHSTSPIVDKNTSNIQDPHVPEVVTAHGEYILFIREHILFIGEHILPCLCHCMRPSLLFS